MVLESIVNPFKAEKHPFELFLIGFIYTTVGLFLGLWIFKDHAGLISVFFTTMAALPLFYRTMKYEEKKDIVIKKESKLLKEHMRALLFFILFFLGCTVAYSVWFSVLPIKLSYEIFYPQANTISEINQKVTGLTINAQFNQFLKIFLNNINVMIFSLFFSFVYGSGAIFILSWNASVIGVAVGNFFKTNLAELLSITGVNSFSNYFTVTYLSFFRYAIHGIPEIFAYFVAGLAGGIFSAAIIRRDFAPERIDRVIKDCSVLMLIAVLIVFFAALIEVYVTPCLFFYLKYGTCY